MPKKKLLENLTELQRQLESIEDPQPEVRRRLAELQKEIQRIEARHLGSLAPESAAAPASARHGDDDDDDDDGFMERLEEYAAEFEAEHPMLSATARDLIRRLASIGI